MASASSSHLRNQNIPFEWECPLTRTGKRSAHSTCAKEFAKELGFQLIETSDDGNCFFYTLTKFGRRSGFEPFLLEPNEHKNAMALRQQLVNHIQDNFHEYGHFLFNNNHGSINEQIEELRGNGVWASEAGDLVPVAAANAFGIHINLYNIEDRGDRDVIRLVSIRSSLPSNVYVSIMRVREGHFQLLWPRSGEFSIERNGQPGQLGQPERAVVAAAHSAVQAAQMAVSIAKQIISSSTSSSFPSSSSSPSSSSFPSLSKNEQALNQISRNLNQLSLGASPNYSGPRRSTRSTRSTRPASSTASTSTRAAPKKRASTRKNRNRNRKNRNNNNNASLYLNNNNLQRAMEESYRYQ